MFFDPSIAMVYILTEIMGIYSKMEIVNGVYNLNGDHENTIC